MPERLSKLRPRRTVMLKLLLSSLILSTTLTGCVRHETRIQFLTPTFQSADLICPDAPRGQLPATATNGEVSSRIIDNDEAGEACRQNLARVKMKVEVFNEVVAQMNAGKDPANIKASK